jgi:crotonobetainyl-CoA:carnitine CoA-transferase CaiB-like acyl-CoA transferase
MPAPLDGYRVIDVTQMVSGPMATMILADQGADVIKVEPRTGDLTRSLGGARRAMAPLFAVVNRNKRSIVLDLKNAAGVEMLKRLVARADVFVQNFRPGAADRMGFGEAELRRINARLIYVSISGFGESGPYAHKRAYDPVIQALSGLASIQADTETGRPRMMRLIIPDKVTALTAAQAITAALLARERTGQGQHVRLAMLDAMVAFLWPEGMARYTFVDAGDSAARPADVRDLVFQTADGYITAAVNSDKEWEALARALEHPEWLDDPRFRTPADRVKNTRARLELTAEVLVKKTSAEWLARLDAAQVPCAPILSREDLLNDPQVRANGLIIESEHPHAGWMRQARPAARFERTSAAPLRPAPLLGEHTDEVLSELGISREDLVALRASGVIGYAPAPLGEGNYAGFGTKSATDIIPRLTARIDGFNADFQQYPCST